MAGSSKWLALAALAAASAANAAQAQECSSDDDCPTSTYCAWGSSDVGSDDGAAGAPCAPDTGCDADPLPSTGTCEPLPEGECEVADDCEAGRACVKSSWINDCPVPAPEPGGDGKDAILPPDECGAEEMTARYGTCETPRVECQSDADCPTGLTCLTSGSVGSGSSDSNGGATDPGVGAPIDEERPGDIAEPEPSAGYCGWVPQNCEEVACAPGYACVEVLTASTCTASDAPSCAPGDTDCGVSEPTDPVCTEEYEKICLPEKQPCEDDTQCQDGWTCMAFAHDDSAPEPPEFWNEPGSVKSCVPGGLATEIENGTGVGGGSTGGVDTATDNPETPRENAGEAKSSSGCSVGATGNVGAFSGFVLAGLVLVRRRRRTR